MGAPLGEEGYEEAFYEDKAAAAVSRIDDTVRLLRHRSPCALHAFMYYCHQHLWDYRLRTCAGADTIAAATATFDRAVERALASYCPSDVDLTAALVDPLLVRRVRLPGRRRGLGVRSRAALLPCAFVGGFVSACEAFLDTPAGGGVMEPGSFHSLAHLFGAGAFAADGCRFRRGHA